MLGTTYTLQTGTPTTLSRNNGKKEAKAHSATEKAIHHASQYFSQGYVPYENLPKADAYEDIRGEFAKRLKEGKIGDGSNHLIQTQYSTSELKFTINPDTNAIYASWRVAYDSQRQSPYMMHLKGTINDDGSILTTAPSVRYKNLSEFLLTGYHH